MLKLDFCTHQAAKYAVTNWHYSRCLPAGKTVKIGVWENSKFIGAVIFSRGANNNQAKSFKLRQDQLAELARVALTKHKTEVTRILAIAIKMLKKLCPGIDLLFSYADETNQGHKGVIYKAGGWEYLGERVCKSGPLILNGKLTHNRSISSKYGGKRGIPKNVKIEVPPPQKKHLFIKKLKRASSVEAAQRPIQGESGGAVPTEALQISK